MKTEKLLEDRKVTHAHASTRTRSGSTVPITNEPRTMFKKFFKSECLLCENGCGNSFQGKPVCTDCQIIIAARYV